MFDEIPTHVLNYSPPQLVGPHGADSVGAAKAAAGEMTMMTSAPGRRLRQA